MRILYFHQYFGTPDGSGGTRSYEFARALIAAGHEVHVVCSSSARGVSGLSGPFRRGRRRGLVDGIEVTEFKLDYSNYDSLPVRARKFLQLAAHGIAAALSERCDLVFATSTPLTASLPGIAARWLRGRRFVFEVRDLWPDIPRGTGVIGNPLVLEGLSALEWCSYRSAHACIGLSPGIAEGIERRAAKGLPIAMISNGCDLELFAPDGSEARAIDGVDEDDLLAVFTGAHGVCNGLDAVLDAAMVLKRDGVAKVKFLFVGDGGLKPALVERVRRERLENCLFLDPVPKRELPAQIARADVALMILDDIPAFYYGTSPNKFFDYLAMGKPVLVNYPGWIADMVREHDAGFAVEPRSPKALAATLTGALARRERLGSMGENALALGRREFDRHLLASRFVAFIEAHAGDAARSHAERERRESDTL